MIENNNLDLSNNGIINNPNQNSFKEVSVIQSKEKESKSKKVSGKYFIFYVSVIILIYILLFINYLKTNNWYEENRHYINLRPFSICSEYISSLENCLNETQKSATMLKKEEIIMFMTLNLYVKKIMINCKAVLIKCIHLAKDVKFI